MKNLIALSLILAASIAGVLVSSSTALAEIVIHSGSICHSYDKNQANDLDYYPNGVKNSASAPIKVICPLAVTHTSGQTTGYVYVDFNTPTAFNCTLYSYSFTDSFLGSKSATTGSGAARYTYIGTVPADSYSNHAVVCTLPANYSGRITAIESNF